MLIKFLANKSSEEIIEETLRYEYHINSFENFIRVSNSDEIFKFILKVMNYYNLKCVENRDLWISGKVKHFRLEDEFKNLKQLLEAANEQSRILGLNLAFYTFQFNKAEIAHLMVRYWHSELIETNNNRVETFELCGYKIIIETVKSINKTYVDMLPKKGLRYSLSKDSLEYHKRFLPKLLNFFIFNNPQ